jgi:hypothetical protein
MPHHHRRAEQRASSRSENAVPGRVRPDPTCWQNRLPFEAQEPCVQCRNDSWRHTWSVDEVAQTLRLSPPQFETD